MEELTKQCTRINRPPLNNKSTQINPLYIGLKRSTTEVKYCCITGIDISHQKGVSKFLSASTILNFYHTERETYLQLERKYLPKKNKYSTIEKRCEAIHHKLRNIKTNPRNNFIKSYNRRANYEKLEPLEDLMRRKGLI